MSAPRVALVALALLASPALAQVSVPADLDLKVGYERAEPGRIELDAAGQMNCLGPNDPASRCAPAPTGRAHPATATLVLDNVYQSDGATDPAGSAAVVLVSPSENADAPVMDVSRGANWHRATGGEVPDVIVPGRGYFLSWHGRWSDANGDGVAQVRWHSSRGPTDPRPSNEWVPDDTGGIVSYIEPGAHPVATSRVRPAEATPDLVYRYVVIEMVHKPAGDVDGRVLFVDGSLFRAMTVETVTHAHLAPSPDGQKPFTASTTSLVDVDRYAAVAPAPVAGAYRATLGPAADAIGSPSVGLCPNACRPGPVPLGATPVAGPAGEVQAAVWAPYPREWEAGSGSTRAGLHEEHVAGYEAWIDLRLFYAAWGGLAAGEAGPLPGRGADGSPSMLPGVLAWEVWTGVWKDLDGDGHIGSAKPGDPYEGGTRPIADDYANPVGEFFGHWPTTDAGHLVQTVYVEVRPTTTWGAGAFILADGAGNPTCEGPGLSSTCYTSGAVLLAGSTPVRLYGIFESETPGRYLGRATLLLPEGSPGLTACSLAVSLEHGTDGNRRRTTLADCDTLAPLADREE
ncbi:MAG TPA: hypothetical protein VM889_03515 [Candidatus Thermoplasmatota archaeon]|nr:hypothetical protein [Candidatus Thermoplasmatota archaeon]